MSESKTYHTVRKSGRCFNGFERDGGKIRHIIYDTEINGFWCGKALCGTDVGYRGNGWSKESRVATCDKCVIKYNKAMDAANLSTSKLVKVYYCGCGESIQLAGDPAKFDRKTKLEFTEAVKWHRKVEMLTLEDFKSKPFMSCKCFENKD